MNLHLPTYSAALPLRRLATIGTLGLAALVFPASSLGQVTKVDGVSALVNQGTLEVRGSSHADAVALRLKAGDPTQVQVDVGDDRTADFTFARSGLSAINASMRAGNDSLRIDDTNGAFTDSIPTRISGGPGNDTLTGGAGAETFYGASGNDTVIGGRGNDTAYLGRGDDNFVWNPGDGSDTIEGNSGTDTMLFNGANVNEKVDLSANGNRLKFSRDVGNVTMDTHGVERVDFNALGGSDNITVNDLTGTGVSKVNLDLAGTLGGSTGDGAIDNLTINGTNHADTINATGNGSGADVTGLAATVSIVHADRNDTLAVNPLAGKNKVTATGVFGMQVSLNLL